MAAVKLEVHLYQLLAAKLDFRHPAACRIISANTVAMADTENIGIAAETALMSSLIAEISVLPVFNSRHIGFPTSGYV